jgi:hypothetical protein
MARAAVAHRGESVAAFAVKNSRINPLAFPQTGLHFFVSHAPEGAQLPDGRMRAGDGDKELAGKAKPRAAAREQRFVRGVMQSPKKHQD